ncbi:methyltransferase domain-containing protein [Colletotrichum navitas]|uniref:Methyltransferase domain-containing protein n=1 Tax=Colletotrichum navitas TaxID=681940 RepID=A0AAD8Q7P7_9PEZI|nr:methyltransferase domain-containing protein [Colletotrichum navitas]KAK1596099.1 methyltransferase domain-containing protein [Colletotrichum navitas]
MADDAQQLVAEDSHDDDASSIAGYSFDNSLASLRSSIYNYRRENGRTYHSLSDGKYRAPNDEREQDRLDLNHHLWILTWDNNLCLSPKKHGAKRVLDVGTGTGIWAQDYADQFPEAMVIGVDLSPIQPDFVSPNCTFEVDDIEKEWTWKVPFDFIFMRTMCGSFSSWPDVIAQAYENLEPGGYLELQDNMFPLMCDDDTMTEDFMPLKWTKYLVEAGDKIGQVANAASSYRSMLEDAGFVDVVEKKEKWPFNPWAKDEKHKALGYWTQESAMKGIEAVSMASFTRILNWSPEEARVFCAEVRNEHTKIGVHAYYDVYAVWGRKPEEAEEKEEESHP